MFDRNNYGELGLFFCFLLSLHSLSCLCFYFSFFQLNSTRREIGRERKIRLIAIQSGLLDWTAPLP